MRSPGAEGPPTPVEPFDYPGLRGMGSGGGLSSICAAETARPAPCRCPKEKVPDSAGYSPPQGGVRQARDDRFSRSKPNQELCGTRLQNSVATWCRRGRIFVPLAIHPAFGYRSRNVIAIGSKIGEFAPPRLAAPAPQWPAGLRYLCRVLTLGPHEVALASPRESRGLAWSGQSRGGLQQKCVHECLGNVTPQLPLAHVELLR